MGDITEIIRRAKDGSTDALNDLFEVIYPDLRRIAHARLRGKMADSDLGTTVLVNECYLKLQAARRLDAPDRGRFFAYVAMAMRSIIIDIARSHGSQRRGGGLQHVEFDEQSAAAEDADHALQIVRVHEAIDDIAAHDERLARLVEMRYFGGYTDEEIAQALDLSARTVRRDWQKARMLLAAALRD
ncbi:MAG TPA: ECF-type sigma factor [Ideonella sp.]|uniref:ECF-type sigma factor n=1 Tax=Ideonella sp. TaxID=1929293 RepID=UPI002C6C5B2B|nr:ECF-type sigma factor [Ideonella sp.]HSI47271.1 ECF-type sigma factor [Ideonella sp.]